MVSDTSSISNLLLIHHLDLLQKIYYEIYIPPTVYTEILNLEKSGQNLEDFKTKAWIIVESEFPRNISLAPPKYVDAGGAEAIDLALHLKAERLLIDERKGTLLANNLGITTIGLLGVLIIAKQNNLITSVKELLDQLVRNEFWLSDNLYQQVLKSVNEL
ncbi:MAG: DUF3368 domain-containing protein [Ginsengibacter sp.]